MFDLFIAVAILLFLLLFARYFALIRTHSHTHIHERKTGGDEHFNYLNRQRIEAKERKLEKVLKLAQEKDFVTNDDVEKKLRVSDSTAERYLEELSKKGELRRIGKLGRGVKYQIRN